VTEKIHPNDFDGCWDSTNVDAALLDPVLLNFDNGRAAQKKKFRGEMFIADGWNSPRQNDELQLGTRLNDQDRLWDTLTSPPSGPFPEVPLKDVARTLPCEARRRHILHQQTPLDYSKRLANDDRTS
jgi:hypothetical protein